MLNSFARLTVVIIKRTGIVYYCFKSILMQCLYIPNRRSSDSRSFHSSFYTDVVHLFLRTTEIDVIVSCYCIIIVILNSVYRGAKQITSLKPYSFHDFARTISYLIISTPGRDIISSKNHLRP